MAFIDYLDDVPERDKVPDSDNILKIHSVNSRIMKNHFNLYVNLMKRSSPVSKKLREMIAVVVSRKNNCHY